MPVPEPPAPEPTPTSGGDGGGSTSGGGGSSSGGTTSSSSSGGSSAPEQKTDIYVSDQYRTDAVKRQKLQQFAQIYMQLWGEPATEEYLMKFVNAGLNSFEFADAERQKDAWIRSKPAEDSIWDLATLLSQFGIGGGGFKKSQGGGNGGGGGGKKPPSKNDYPGSTNPPPGQLSGAPQTKPPPKGPQLTLGVNNG